MNVINNIIWENKNFLYLILLLPFWLFLVIFLIRFKSQKIAKYFNPLILDTLSLNISWQKKYLKIFLESLILLFLIFALAKPYIPKGNKEIKSEGIEILLLVDVSLSMLANDIEPNRLTYAKKELIKLVENLPGHRFGIIAFAARPIVIAPLTNDRSAIKMYLESLSPNMISNQGTNIQLAFKEAVKVFQNGAIQDKNTFVSKVILLASDGEHQENTISLKEFNLKNKQNPINLYSLAFGTQKGEKIPINSLMDLPAFDNQYFKSEFKKDKKGQIVTSKANLNLLENIAKKNRGNFYHYIPGANNLAKKIAIDLNKLNKIEFDKIKIQNKEYFYHLFLFLALLLIIIELFITTNILSSDKKKKFFFNTNKSKLTILIIIFSFMQLFFANRIKANIFFSNNDKKHKIQNPLVWYYNTKGLILNYKKDYYSAYSNFRKSLDHEPLIEATLFNIAHTLQKQKEFTDAIKIYSTLGNNSENQNIRFQSWFNLAIIFTKTNNLDPALESYQKCLDIDPTSLPVKTNIEFLFKQMKGANNGGNKNNQQSQKRKYIQNPKNNKNCQNKVELSEENLKRIFDELKRQELEIKYKEYQKNNSKFSNDNDW